MVVLIALCQPYNKENRIINYIDALIFTNLAIINALSLYLYASTSMSNQAPSHSIFLLQYILILLPLVYMIVCVVWYIVKCQNWLMRRLHCCNCLRKKSYQPLTEVTHEDDSSIPPFTRSEVDVNKIHTHEEDEALFARAEVTNQFRSSPGRSNAGTGYTTPITSYGNTMKSEVSVSEAVLQGRQVPQLEEAVKAMGAYLPLSL